MDFAVNREHYSRLQCLHFTFSCREFNISHHVHSYLKIVTLALKLIVNIFHGHGL